MSVIWNGQAADRRRLRASVCGCPAPRFGPSLLPAIRHRQGTPLHALRLHPRRRRPCATSPACCWPAWPRTAASTSPKPGPTSSPRRLARAARPALSRARRPGHAALRRRRDPVRDPASRSVATPMPASTTPPSCRWSSSTPSCSSQELFHGPTLAFKDMALQLLGRLFDHVLTARDERVTIVGATSGDTGSAAIEACAGPRPRRHRRSCTPTGRTSEVQRRQMTTVHARQRRATSPSRALSTTARTW